MTESNKTQPESTIRLEQLILLHEEIVALVRANVPLDSGLQLLGEDLPGHLGKIARSLSASMSRGRSLDEALDEHASDFPRVYRAVVRAGLRSGRLTLAMESLSVALARIRDTRDFVLTSMIYPTIVLGVAIAGCLFLTIYIHPNIQMMFNDMALDRSKPLSINTFSIINPVFWITMGVILFFVLSLILNRGRRNLTLVRLSVFSGMFAMLPWSRHLMRNVRSSVFVEVLTLLLKSGVPLGEALQLAGESVGDPWLVNGCTKLNEKLKKGEQVSAQVYRELGLPPLASWALVMGQKEGDVVGLLQHVSETYKLQAESVSCLLRQYTPVILTGLVAGGAVLLYVLWLFIPYVTLLKYLSG
ncbi:MAG: type II secretion system F family protein [Planctomycetia bacterium]|jgi:type II secretory pathway component PulF